MCSAVIVAFPLPIVIFNYLLIARHTPVANLSLINLPYLRSSCVLFLFVSGIMNLKGRNLYQFQECIGNERKRYGSRKKYIVISRLKG